MNLLSLDLNLLRVLDALLREQSTVKAGERIGLSQPAVSSALGRLRLSLGDPLFVRQGQRIVPTDFARGLEAPLRRTLEDIEALLSLGKTFDPAGIDDTFRIAGVDFFAEMLLPSLEKRLNVAAPLIRIQLVDPKTADVIEFLDNNDVDIVLEPDFPTPDWLDRKPVFDVNFVVIARRGNPELLDSGLEPGDVIPIELYCRLRHVLMSRSLVMKGIGDAALSRLGLQRNIVMTLPFFSGVYNMVAQSDVVALVPFQLAKRVESRLDLVTYRLPFEIDRTTISMFWHRRRTANPAHRWMRNIISEILAPLS